MDWVIVAATVVIACSAVVSAWLTWRLSRDNRTLLKAGTEPEVVAYLGLDERYPSVVNLVLENIGQGPACDVEFFVDADPADFADHEVSHVTAGSRRKISSLLPQGGRIERRMAAGFQLLKEEENATLRPFRVEVSYSDLRGARAGPRGYMLDVSDFGGALSSRPADERTAESLEEIKKHLGHFASGFSRLHVQTTTAAEQEAALEERRARFKARAAAAANEDDDETS